VAPFTEDLVNQAFDQDDLYVETTFLRALEQYGVDVPITQAGVDFANSQYRLWVANAAGRSNLRKGIAPPDSSHPIFHRSAFLGMSAPKVPSIADLETECANS